MADSQSSAVELTILYGSQTGNAEYLAYQVSEEVGETDLTVEMLTMNDALQQESINWKRLLIVTSTHDNGHMPENAQAFWDWLQTLDSGYFANLPFSVLTIGDSMYDDFCLAGQDLQAKMLELGATEFLKMGEFDVDYDMTSLKWREEFLEVLPSVAEWNRDGSDSAAKEIDISNIEIAEEEKLYEATISSYRKLSTDSSTKSVFHYELDVEDGFVYESGDSVDVFPINSESLVNEWLKEFPDVDKVTIGEETVDFKEALTSRLELRLPHFSLAIALAEEVADTEIAKEVLEFYGEGDRTTILKWLWSRDVLDIVREIGATRLGAQGIVDHLRAIQNRSYSIASSPVKHGTGLHLTVSQILFEREGRDYAGCATAYLDSLAKSKEKFAVKRIPAHSFHLPESDDKPVIMIGPGVGVAPFIGFLHEIEHLNRKNQTWLFFGDRNKESDWIYDGEMSDWLDKGVLNNLSLAFSRDTDEKHYVQDEIRKNASDVKQWVEDGAYIFVCGDKDRMAHDVEDVLTEILGKDLLEELKQDERYVKDVY